MAGQSSAILPSTSHTGDSRLMLSAVAVATLAPATEVASAEISGVDSAVAGGFPAKPRQALFGLSCAMQPTS